MTPPNLIPAARAAQPVWSVETFEQFWADPDPARVPPQIFAADVVGDWPGNSEPVRGVPDYVQRLADLIALLPDMRLQVAEHAVHGEYTFIRWILRATGALGPFELSGIDRVRQRNGLITENVIRFDSAQFEARAGHPLPCPERGHSAGVGGTLPSTLGPTVRSETVPTTASADDPLLHRTEGRNPRHRRVGRPRGAPAASR